MSYPTPTVETPDKIDIMEQFNEDGSCEATDGCRTDADNTCEHGHPSWLLLWGMI